MSEKLSELDQEHIADIVSGSGAPSVSSAKANLEPTFAETYPLTASYLSGVAKPAAGLAQWIGIHEPARYLHDVEKEAKSTGRTGVGASEFAGEMAGLLLGGELTPGASAAIAKNPLLTGATTGAATSAVMPTHVTEGESYEDFLKQKASDIAMGAGLGGAFGKGSQLLFAPIVGKKVQALKDMGMKEFTPGQLVSDIPFIGPMLQRGEQALSSVPVVGSLMKGGRQNAIEDFNRAVGNHVLQPMDEALSKTTNVGHELADEVYNKVTNAYQEIAPKLKFNAKFKNPETGETTLNTLNTALKDVTENLDANQAKSVASTYRKFIIDPLQSDLTMTGERFRQAESNLGNAAYDAYKAGNTTMGAAYRELQSNLRGMLAKQNPQNAAELSGIHESFKRWLRLEKAAAKRGAEEGVFTPSQFASSVESLGGRSSARGKALMQDEAKAAESVLGSKVPDSGTAERAMSGALLTGGSLFGGIPFLPTVAALGAYSKPGMRALTKLATERPELMRAFSPEVQTAAATAGGINANQYAKGGILVNFKKKSKKLAQGGVISLAEGGKPSLDDTLLSIDRAKENIAHTYETAKDFISNPTPYLNKFKQIPSIVNDPAEPISHYLKGDISGGLKLAGDYLSEKSPEELAMGFAQPGAMGIVGSIENAGVRFTSPLKNTVSSHKLESMPGSQWSSWLESNAPKAAKKESDAIGLHEWAKEQPKLTKQDIHEYVDLNTPKIVKRQLKQDNIELSPQEIEKLNFLEEENTKNPLGGIDDIHGEGSYNELMRLQNIRDKSTVERLYAQQPILERWAHEADARGQNSDIYWDGINHLTARAEALDLQGAGLKDETRYESYTLPGGKDYNETTLTIPKPMSEYNQFSDMLHAKYGNIPFDEAPLTKAERKTLDNITNKEGNGVYFVPQAHRYGNDVNDANRLLHYRTNVRPVENGKSALFLEELQSDWGQQGREEGFKPVDWDSEMFWNNPEYKAAREHSTKLNNAFNSSAGNPEVQAKIKPLMEAAQKEEKKFVDQSNEMYEKMWRAPYVTDTKEWTALGVKNALQDAVEKNHDYLAWTNGEQQADRYKLSKFIKDLHYEPNEDGTYNIDATGHNGGNVIYEEDVPEHKLKDLVGKELAKKIVSDSGDHIVQDTGFRNWRKFSGVDLDVGSLGMKGYYDQILPQVMNDVLKQLGSKEKVQNVNVHLGEPVYGLKNKTTGSVIGGGYSLEEAKQSVAQNPNREMYLVSGGTSPQMGVKLTPELKQKILKEGIPKFKQGGLLGKFKKK